MAALSIYSIAKYFSGQEAILKQAELVLRGLISALDIKKQNRCLQTDVNSYRVQVWLGDDDIFSHIKKVSCTCPTLDYHCEHVAMLLIYTYNLHQQHLNASCASCRSYKKNENTGCLETNSAISQSTTCDADHSNRISLLLFGGYNQGTNQACKRSLVTAAVKSEDDCESDSTPMESFCSYEVKEEEELMDIKPVIDSYTEENGEDCQVNESRTRFEKEARIAEDGIPCFDASSSNESFHTSRLAVTSPSTKRVKTSEDPDGKNLKLLLPDPEDTGVAMQIVSYSSALHAGDIVDNNSASPCSIKLHLKTNKDSDLLSWKESFCILTSTDYIVKRMSRIDGTRLSMSKMFVCQLASVGKVSSSNRATGCRAMLHLKIRSSKACIKKRDGFLAEIDIHWHHNHLIINHQALSLLKVPSHVRDKAMLFFAHGISPSNVKRIIEADIAGDVTSGSDVDFYNRHINPNISQLKWLYDQWKKSQSGESKSLKEFSKSQAFAEAFQKRKDELLEQGFVVTSYDETDLLTCCFTSPIMRRAADLPSAAEFLFVDTMSSVDTSGLNVTFVFMVTLGGAVPICALMHKGLSEEVYQRIFSLASQVAIKHPPAVLMTNDSSAVRNALHSVFPTSTLLLRFFHHAQATWHWLCDQRHGVSKEERQKCMNKYSALVTAVTAKEAQKLMEEATKEGADLPQFKRYIENQWEEREQFMVAYRSALPIIENNTNHYADATIGIVKDIILFRMRSHNVVAFIEFFSTKFEQYIRARILAAGNCSSSDRIRKYRNTVANSEKSSSYDIEEIESGVFSVRSPSTGYDDDPEPSIYRVTPSIGFCTCFVGCTRAVCKHQVVVASRDGLRLNNIPTLTRDQKRDLVILALGETDMRLDTFDDMHAIETPDEQLPAACVAPPTMTGLESPTKSNDIIDVLQKPVSLTTTSTTSRLLNRIIRFFVKYTMHFQNNSSHGRAQCVTGFDYIYLSVA